MFKFETEQKICEIGGVLVGGQPGEYPTVVCSSIFQKGDRVFAGKRWRILWPTRERNSNDLSTL
jgi:tetrahydromethanopterin S-methyltransferase subunit H